MTSCKINSITVRIPNVFDFGDYNPDEIVEIGHGITQARLPSQWLSMGNCEIICVPMTTVTVAEFEIPTKNFYDNVDSRVTREVQTTIPFWIQIWGNLEEE